jgi:hypothetical protein
VKLDADLAEDAGVTNSRRDIEWRKLASVMVAHASLIQAHTVTQTYLTLDHIADLPRIRSYFLHVV